MHNRPRRERTLPTRPHPSALAPRLFTEEAIRHSRLTTVDVISNSDREWLEQIADASGVVYFLTPEECTTIQGPLCLREDEILVEARCAKLASEHQYLGIYLPSMCFLPMRCFQPESPSTAGHHRHPVLAGAGRYICHHELQTALAKLKAQWLLIPPQSRPSLPFDQDRISAAIAGCSLNDFAALHSYSEKTLPEIWDFWETAQKLLRAWDLHSLISWEFPEPLGDDTASTLPIEFYWQKVFPTALSESSRDFSRRVEEVFRQRREKLGLKDLLARAESYAQIARLHRVRLLVDSRLRATGTLLDERGLYADLMGCSEGHVRRLLDQMEQLTAGLASQLPQRIAKEKKLRA